MSFTYLVEYAGRKRIVNVQQKSHLMDAILKEFALKDQSGIILQMFVTEWDTYVDVTDVLTLPNRCKLCITRELMIVIAGGEAEISTTKTNDTVDNGPTQPHLHIDSTDSTLPVVSFIEESESVDNQPASRYL